MTAIYKWSGICTKLHDEDNHAWGLAFSEGRGGFSFPGGWGSGHILSFIV